jgi:hypothetical protein
MGSWGSAQIFCIYGELGNWRPVSCPVWYYKYGHRRGTGFHLVFLVLCSGSRSLCPLSSWHPPPAFTMDPGKCPTSDASGGGRSAQHRVMGAGSSSGGGRGRRLPLAVTMEPGPLLNAAPAMVVEIEVDRLRRYLGLLGYARGARAGDAGYPRPACGRRQPGGR